MNYEAMDEEHRRLLQVIRDSSSEHKPEPTDGLTLRAQGPPALETLWAGAGWLSDRLELLGMVAVGAFLVATTAAVVLAPRLVISRAACEEEAQTKLRESLLSYARRPMSGRVIADRIRALSAV